jgi:hypothetical protein
MVEKSLNINLWEAFLSLTFNLGKIYYHPRGKHDSLAIYIADNECYLNSLYDL